MALYVTRYHEFNGYMNEMETQQFHIPLKKSLEKELLTSDCQLLSCYWIVQADGDELEAITTALGLAQGVKRRVVRFFGDDARFIIANL